MVQDEAGVPPIMWEVPGTYARTVFHDRHPKLLRQLAEAFPLTLAQRDALYALVDETLHGPVAPLPPDAPDAATWATWGKGRFARPWAEASFLWAESYFYRRLLDAFGYLGPGAWHGVDPFGPAKSAELRGAAVDDELAGLDELDGLPGGQLRDALLTASLWGNRADLGFLVTAEAAEADTSLLADDSARMWTHLDAHPGGRICWVADNAGRELLPDLVLIDHLLTTGLAAEVTLHVKPRPYYVSDATPRDTLAALRRLRDAGGAAERIGTRLWQAVADGRLALRAHAFACAPLPYNAMPDDLRADFASATLTVFKGDLNHRRLVGDLHWPATTPFADTVGYFPGPVVTLRTLKSDVAVGLDASTVARLDESKPGWRTTGGHAVIQFQG